MLPKGPSLIPYNLNTKCIFYTYLVSVATEEMKTTQERCSNLGGIY